MSRRSVTRVAFVCLSALALAGVIEAKGDRHPHGKRIAAESYTFEVSVANKGKTKVEYVKFVVDKENGFGLARGRHICLWNLRLGLAAVLNNMFVPLVPHAPATLTTLSKIPDVGTIICDELLVETEILAGQQVSANAVREALRGTWQSSGAKGDLPLMESQFVIVSIHQTSSPDLPFDKLELSVRDRLRREFVTIKLVSRKSALLTEQKINADREPSKSGYAESMETLLGYNGGRVLGPQH